MRIPSVFSAALLVAVCIAAAMPARSFAEGSIDGNLGYKKALQYTSADGMFKLKRQFRIQFRTEIESTNEDGSDTETDFMIRRVKLKFGGHAYEKWMKYGFQLAGHAGRGDREDDIELEDAFLAVVKSEAADLKVGRYKIPYGREVLNSSSALQFVDRSHIKEFVIDNARADGFSVGGILGNFVAYRAGLFQFDDEKFKGGDNMLFAGRVQANICCGELKYSSGSFPASGDYKITPNFAKVPTFSIGVGWFAYNGEKEAVSHTEGSITASKELDIDSRSGVTVDMIAKYERANFEAAFYYGSTKTAKKGADTKGTMSKVDDEPTLGTHGNGNWAYRLQGGFLLTPQLEIATRWAAANWDRNSGEKDEWQWTTGFNYYIAAKHKAKFQVDYTYGNEEGGIRKGKDKTTNLFRAQLQLYL